MRLRETNLRLIFSYFLKILLSFNYTYAILRFSSTTSKVNISLSINQIFLVHNTSIAILFLLLMVVVYPY